MGRVAEKTAVALTEQDGTGALRFNAWRVRETPTGEVTGEIDIQMAGIDAVRRLREQVHGGTVLVNGVWLLPLGFRG